jgi:hypothetical protein
MVYNIQHSFLVLDEQEEPYFFILIPGLRMQNIFIINKKDYQLTKEYLHAMLHKYWDLQDEHTLH